MGKVWVLDTETKGTGANMVPIEKTQANPESKPLRPARKRSAAGGPPGRPKPKPKRPAEVSSTPLPPGHVRRRATGEIGKVQAVDPKAGTVTVLWLKRGGVSTVPLSAVTRR